MKRAALIAVFAFLAGAAAVAVPHDMGATQVILVTAYGTIESAVRSGHSAADAAVPGPPPQPSHH